MAKQAAVSKAVVRSTVNTELEGLRRETERFAANIQRAKQLMMDLNKVMVLLKQAQSDDQPE